MKKVLFTAVVVLLVAAFGISAFMVGNYLIDGKKQEERYDELSNIAANKNDATASGLTRGKTYYFKVRTYKTTDSGYVYSPFSTVQSIKVK